MPAVATFCVLLSLIALAGCELSNDDSFALDRLPQPFVVETVSPENNALDVALNQPISIRFSHYLDADSFEFFNALIVSSGGRGVGGFSRYNLTTRTLTFYPTNNYQPDLTYLVTVNPETVRSLDGQALALPLELRFQTASEGQVVQDDRVVLPVSFAELVEPVLQAGCSCHTDGRAPISLDYDSLISRPALGVTARLVVEPFAPERSYLLHKLLPNYGDRRLTEMPPVWGDEPALTEEAIGLIERWIATGASP